MNKPSKNTRYPTFSTANFKKRCDQVAAVDRDLKSILDQYGYPPMWSRPNTFETMVHIILEQQVSLASALSALNKLREKLKVITPESLLQLSDEELRTCYFSRQKMGYVRHLATAMINNDVVLEDISRLSSDEIRKQLCKVKGIGDWTVDIYLILALCRADIFPIGDLAAVKALKKIKQLPASTTREEILEWSEHWFPYRTIATMILWHYYLSAGKGSQ